MMSVRTRPLRLAGVDIGTLTCRFLIADIPATGRLTELRSERCILRLGEGVDQTGQLSVAAMDRVIQCLQEWRERIDAFHVDATATVATSARALSCPLEEAGSAAFRADLASMRHETQYTRLFRS